MIRKTVGGPAAGPTEGVLVYDGAGTTATDTSIADSETYYYTAFVYDKGDPSNLSTASPVSISIPPASGPSALNVRALAGTKIYLGGNPAHLGELKGTIPTAGDLRITGLKPKKTVIRATLVGFYDAYRLVKLQAGENTVTLDLIPFDPTDTLMTPATLQAGGAPLRGGGNFAAPFVVDWDNDGRKDLVVAGGDGALLLYQNVGTDAAPEFGAGIPLTADGAALAVPGPAFAFVADWDDDGNKDLLVGDGQGSVRWSHSRRVSAGRRRGHPSNSARGPGRSRLERGRQERSSRGGRGRPRHGLPQYRHGCGPGAGRGDDDLAAGRGRRPGQRPPLRHGLE
jgi:hypothetical protein